jgi:CTP synthase
LIIGVLIPGGFGTRGVEGKIAAANWARTNGKPFLGICLGLQCAVVEFARNVLGKENAHTTEIDPDTLHPVVIDMPEHNQGQLGGTMRLGKRTTVFKSQDSVMKKLYGNEETIEERHRHRYEVNPSMIRDFEEAGMIFVGQDTDGTRMEIMELQGHPFYTAVQYHPEYLSRPLRPSPPFLGLILAATGKLETFLAKGCKIRENHRDDDSSDEEDEELANLVRKTFNAGISSNGDGACGDHLRTQTLNKKSPSPSTSSSTSPRSGNETPK